MKKIEKLICPFTDFKSISVTIYLHLWEKPIVNQCKKKAVCSSFLAVHRNNKN